MIEIQNWNSGKKFSIRDKKLRVISRCVVVVKDMIMHEIPEDCTHRLKRDPTLFEGKIAKARSSKHGDIKFWGIGIRFSCCCV